MNLDNLHQGLFSFVRKNFLASSTTRGKSPPIEHIAKVGADRRQHIFERVRESYPFKPVGVFFRI
jgi:hypothetical protein